MADGGIGEAALASELFAGASAAGEAGLASTLLGEGTLGALGGLGAEALGSTGALGGLGASTAPGITALPTAASVAPMLPPGFQSAGAAMLNAGGGGGLEAGLGVGGGGVSEVAGVPEFAGSGMSYDSFGSVIPAGSPAASFADPTGLTQMLRDPSEVFAEGLSQYTPPPVTAPQVPTPSPNMASDLGQSFGDALTPYSRLNPDVLNAAKPSFFDNPLKWWQGLDTKEKLLYGGGAGLAALLARDSNRYGMPKQAPYTGPLSRFSYNPSTFRPSTPYASGGITALAQGGAASDLGSYSDGGRMLRGPGDGMSDSIPASIEGRQPARLADSEFVVPADVVSHLGNGSTDAGAKQLYSMMDRVRMARTGTKKQGKQINPKKFLPA